MSTLTKNKKPYKILDRIGNDLIIKLPAQYEFLLTADKSSSDDEVPYLLSNEYLNDPIVFSGDADEAIDFLRRRMKKNNDSSLQKKIH